MTTPRAVLLHILNALPDNTTWSEAYLRRRFADELPGADEGAFARALPEVDRYAGLAAAMVERSEIIEFEVALSRKITAMPEGALIIVGANIPGARRLETV